MGGRLYARDPKRRERFQLVVVWPETGPGCWLDTERRIKPEVRGWPLDGPSTGTAPTISLSRSPPSFYFTNDKLPPSPSGRALWEMIQNSQYEFLSPRISHWEPL